MRPLTIGMIGYGFMGRAHSHAYRTVNQFFPLQRRPALQAVCGRDRAKATAFAETWGYASVETDWRALIARADIDLIDIGAPNREHHAMALAAARAGKMVLCA
jgi:predicted dehydrogenase